MNESKIDILAKEKEIEAEVSRRELEGISFRELAREEMKKGYYEKDEVETQKYFLREYKFRLMECAFQGDMEGAKNMIELYEKHIEMLKEELRERHPESEE